MVTTASVFTLLNVFTGDASAQQVAETTLDFKTQKVFTASAKQTFNLRGQHLSAPVTVSTNPPFLVSKDSLTYSRTISYDTTEMVFNQTVYIKFKPTIIGNYADSVVTASEGADNKVIALTGKASFRTSGLYNRLDANNVITPNGDGRNDTWVIKNLEQYPNNTVRLTDKSGNVIYSKHGYANDWGGTYQDMPLPQGTYYYVVDFGEGQETVFRGFITIVRD